MGLKIARDFHKMEAVFSIHNVLQKDIYFRNFHRKSSVLGEQSSISILADIVL